MWNVNFYAGGLALLISRRLDQRHGLKILLVGVVSLLALLALNQNYADIEAQQSHPLDLLLLAIPFILIIAGAVLTERQTGFVLPKIFLKLGDASYVIYLVHSAIISVLCQLFYRHISGMLPPQLLFFLILGMAVGAGVAAHYVVERPLLAMIRGIGQCRAGVPACRWLQARRSSV
jgi:peptidoglycan/LPS O-acetylase OafA/YrhL